MIGIIDPLGSCFVVVATALTQSESFVAKRKLSIIELGNYTHDPGHGPFRRILKNQDNPTFLSRRTVELSGKFHHSLHIELERIGLINICYCLLIEMDRFIEHHGKIGEDMER